VGTLENSRNTADHDHFVYQRRAAAPQARSPITARIVDISGNDPPNPVADDRNNSYTSAP
jgi:hypothetical protein